MKSLIKIFFIAFVLTLWFSQQAKAQIAVLNSKTSSEIYSSKFLDSYDKLWDEVTYTLNNTNIKYNIISEEELNSGNISKDFNILILPLIFDLPEKTFTEIEKYINNGGKIIIIFPGDYTGTVLSKLAGLTSIELSQSKSITSVPFVDMSDNTKISENNFPLSTKIADIKTNSLVKTLAVWNKNQENIPAVTVSNAGSYIGWQWGNEGSLTFNTDIMKKILESLVPGIVEKEQVKLNFKDFEVQLKEIQKFRESTQDFLGTMVKSSSSELLPDIQEHIYLSELEENLSRLYYQDKDYEKTQEELKKAKRNTLMAYAKVIPSNIVEGRTLWIDRGLIVSIKNQQEMSDLFDKIKQTGINLVYFETLNAGFAIYPSKITEQNPLITGYDPLKWAIEEAHKRNIEIHAWTWIFAVGNTRHNPLIGKPAEYPGPIISKNYELALTGLSNNLVPDNQHEYWLDPSSSRTKNLILSILEEIVNNYDVDGIQLDYIRYPFQSENNQMGFNTEAKRKFEIETGYKLDNLDKTTLKAWNEWKTKQVSRFVQEASERLHIIKPGIQISAAVFGGDRQTRLNTIQQDWEYWAEKGWIDILNPMIYASNTEKLAKDVEYFKKAVGNKAFVYPGISVRQLEPVDLLEQIYTIKDLGLSGNTIFAMTHLVAEKSELLSLGPYKIKEAGLPNKNPLDSAKLILKEFIDSVNTINQSNNSTFYEKIIKDATEAQDYISNISDTNSYDDYNKVLLNLQDLETLTQNTLMLDEKIKPSTIKFLVNYIKEAEVLVSYKQYKQSLK